MLQVYQNNGEMNRYAFIRSALQLIFLIGFSGSLVHGLEYDYSATSECLEEAWDVQYGGGIIANSGFSMGTRGWKAFGQADIMAKMTNGGEMFIASTNRKHPTDGFSQKINLKKGKIYAFSGWLQVNEGSATVAVAFRAAGGEMLYGGGVLAQHGCWSMLKGGIVSNFSGPVDMVFESNNTAVEIWADNIALQPFTENQWRSHQDKTIKRVRKKTVKFTTKSPSATITLKQTKPSFPIGCEINANILNNTAYQDWFTARFTVTAFGNEMKWYSNEKEQGQENYTVPDAMLAFAEQNNIAVRGHNVLWDDPRYQPTWVSSLSPDQLQTAVEKRINSVVSRYKGRVIAWDVVNENVHFRFYEDKLGENTSAVVYGKVGEVDPCVILFMNEYNTIEMSRDQDAAPDNYKRKLDEILGYPGNSGLSAGIGLQSRFGPGQPNLAYMRAGMDYLAASGFPLWLTEVFVDQGENQGQYLEDVLREGYAHPAVKGIVIWPTSPFADTCKMCLTDKDFHNTANGDVVDRLIDEWMGFETTLQCNTSCSVSLFHGEYEATIFHSAANFTATMNLIVKEDTADEFVRVELATDSVKISQI